MARTISVTIPEYKTNDLIKQLKDQKKYLQLTLQKGASIENRS